MRIVIFSVLFIAFSLLGNSCAERRMTEAERLLKSLGLSIPEERRVYLLIPSSICKNCYRFDGLEYPELFRERFRIISSVDTINFPHFEGTIRDTNDLLVKCAFMEFQLQFVLTEKSRVQAIIPCHSFTEQSDSLFRLFLEPDL